MSQIEINETQLLSDVIAFRLKRKLLLKQRIQETREELKQLRKLSTQEKTLLDTYVSKGVDVRQQLSEIRSQKEKFQKQYDDKTKEITPKITLLSKAERYLLDVKAPQILMAKGVTITPKEPSESLVKEISQKN
jgi:hypothetical protein